MPKLRPALLLLLLLLLSACKVDLYSKLGERDAMEMVALLTRHGIDAERAVAKDGTNVVRVEKDQLANAVDLLRANRLPRQSFATMGEVFQQQGLIASPTEERAKFVFALSQELSRTLNEIDGVMSARVHVVLPHNDPLRQKEDPSAAAVFLRHDAQAPIADLIPQVKLLVANSIQGLTYDKVTVVLVPVERAAPEMPVLSAPAQWTAVAPNGVVLGAGAAAALVAAGGLVLLRRRRQAKPAGPGLPAMAAAEPAIALATGRKAA